MRLQLPLLIPAIMIKPLVGFPLLAPFQKCEILSVRTRAFFHEDARTNDDVGSTLEESSPVSNTMDGNDSFLELCHTLAVEPVDVLRLETKNNVRGVYLNRPVRRGDAILSMPLTRLCTKKICPSRASSRSMASRTTLGSR